MAKKTLLSEGQVSKFMKLANIKSDKISGFKKRLNEEYNSGYTMEEDEPAADEEADMDMDMADEAADVADMDMDAAEADMDMEPEAPTGGDDIEIESDELGKLLAPMIKSAVMDALAEAGVTDADADDDDEEMDFESDEMTDEDEGGMDMEEEDEAEMEEEEQEEELQEAKKNAMKAAKKTRNLKGGDAKKKMKESLAFDNVDLVTDDEIINEVLKRVIRRIV